MKRRLCKECGGYVRPTRELGKFSKQLRVFICVDCGYESEWVDKPELDGSFGELHKTKKGYDITSMQSDPAFNNHFATKRKRRRKVKK